MLVRQRRDQSNPVSCSVLHEACMYLKPHVSLSGAEVIAARGSPAMHFAMPPTLPCKLVCQKLHCVSSLVDDSDAPAVPAVPLFSGAGAVGGAPLGPAGPAAPHAAAGAANRPLAGSRQWQWPWPWQPRRRHHRDAVSATAELPAAGRAGRGPAGVYAGEDVWQESAPTLVVYEDCLCQNEQNRMHSLTHSKCPCQGITLPPQLV
jgi:hypothetical protein